MTSSRKCCTTNVKISTLMIIGIVLLVGGCVLIPEFPKLIQSQIKKNIVIKKGSQGYDEFLKPTSPLYMSYYVFDLQNEADVLNGEKPKVIQRGPYTYKEMRENIPVLWEDGGNLLTYLENKTYIFDQEMSCSNCTENDNITTPNIVALTFINDTMKSNTFVKVGLAGIMSAEKVTMFHKLTVKEIVFGYNDTFLQFLKSVEDNPMVKSFLDYLKKHDPALYAKIPNINPFLQLQYNGTAGMKQAGNTTIMTGQNDIKNLQLTTKWKGNSLLPFWNSTYGNMINGTDGTHFSPNPSKTERLYIFVSDVCSSEPLFSPARYKDKELCLICSNEFKQKDIGNSLTNTGWKKFKENAEKWSNIDIPFSESTHRFTEVFPKIRSLDDPFGKVHKSCRAVFENNSDRFKQKYGLVNDSSDPCEDSVINGNDDSTVPSPRKRVTRSRQKGSLRKEKCFICNEEKGTDLLKGYNQGGIGRCSDTNAANKILERKEAYLADKGSRFHDASRRLELLLSGESHDIFAVDVYYHQACYLKYTHSAWLKEKRADVEDAREEHALQSFFYKFQSKIIRDKQAFLLHELLKDVALISEEIGLNAPVIQTTQTLKRRIIDECGPEISFYNSGKYLIVHASDVNPCEYAIATLHGCGLRDDDLSKAFGRMVKRKLEARRNAPRQWPCTTEEILSQLDRGPLPEIYNAIFYTLKDYGEKNEYGYNKTISRVRATKIWSLASDWEHLITKQPSPKQAILGLVLHRITGSKESINYLHKLNHIVSYNDIRLQNMAWSRMVMSKKAVTAGLRKGVVTHSTIDNIDAAQDTITGAGTTHFTNKTVFQLLRGDQDVLPTIAECPQTPLSIDDEPEMQSVEVPEYSLGKRCGPSVFSKFNDSKDDGLLDERFKKDFAWSLAGFLPLKIENEELPLLDSTNDLANVDKRFLGALVSLRQSPSKSTLENVMAMQSFKDMVASLLDDVKDELFQNATVNKDNAPFCVPKCYGTGVLHIGQCLPMNPPILMSGPHFYQGDPMYYEAIDGLKPNPEKHGTFLYVEPYTGITMKAFKRLQVNIEIQNDPGYEVIMHKVRDFLYPIMYIEEHGLVGDADAKKFKNQVYFAVSLGEYLQYGLIALGGVLVLSAVVVGACAERKRKSALFVGGCTPCPSVIPVSSVLCECDEC
eukprot:gene574-10262_t